MRKKTHEEYVKEVSVKNPTIEVIGKYIDAKTKILHHCLIHDIFWNISPSNVLRGRGCKMCGSEKLHNFHQKTHEQYVKEVATTNPNITVLESYIDARTPILHMCKIHNIKWKIAPHGILSGHGCYKCKSEKIINKNTKTHQQYIEELKIVNPDIIVLEDYVDSSTPILHKCLVDGYKWKISPLNTLSGRGCQKCSKRIHRNHEEYVYEVSLINPNIKVLGSFVNMITPILHKCTIHNVEWFSSPYNILKGHGCYECGNEKIKNKNTKTHQQYVEELKIANPDIIVVDTYINSYEPILHRCKIDGYEWKVSPSSMLSKKNGCPQCNESVGERYVRQWLKNHNIIYEYQKTFDDCRDNRVLPFDFYLPAYNCCIEYDGKQHFESIEYFGGQKSFEYRKKHDDIKNEYCKNNGISLLRIPYFKNVEEELNNFLFI